MVVALSAIVLEKRISESMGTRFALNNDCGPLSEKCGVLDPSQADS